MPNISAQRDASASWSGIVCDAEVPEAVERQRVEFAGGVGEVLSFRTTPKGVLQTKLPLGVRDDGDNMTWHQVFVFRHGTGPGGDEGKSDYMPGRAAAR